LGFGSHRSRAGLGSVVPLGLWESGAELEGGNAGRGGGAVLRLSPEKGLRAPGEERRGTLSYSNCDEAAEISSLRFHKRRDERNGAERIPAKASGTQPRASLRSE
jgi:hypothetical protein